MHRTAGSWSVFIEDQVESREEHMRWAVQLVAGQPKASKSNVAVAKLDRLSRDVAFVAG
jgi:hypothetical protein